MFEIILTENDKKIKTLYTYSREYDALYRFTSLVSKKIYFPKKQVYKEKKLTEVHYNILLLKKRGEGDKGIVVRDKYGKLLESFMENPEWIVLSKSEYNLEEQFFVTGANRKLNAKEIIKYVLLPKIGNKNPKQVLMLNNKIIVEGITLNLITCKDVDEAVRLYNYFRVYCFDKKTQNIIFFGSIPKENRSVWYKKINKLTGISYNRLYRKSSR
jgi:hypothetical protein